MRLETTVRTIITEKRMGHFNCRKGYISTTL